MPSRFERIDAEVRAIGAQLLEIGSRLVHAPEDVSVLGPGDTAVPPDNGSDGWLGIDDELPTKEQIKGLLTEWHAAKPETGLSSHG